MQNFSEGPLFCSPNNLHPKQIQITTCILFLLDYNIVINYYNQDFI